MSPLVRMCVDCTTIITTGTRCATHQRQHHHNRNNRPQARIYHTPEWRKTRAIVLERAGHQCQLCGERATIADHHPLPVLACADPYNPDTCRPLCPRCSGTVDGRSKHGSNRPSPAARTEPRAHQEVLIA